MRTARALWRVVPTRPLLAALVLVTMLLTLVAMHAATEEVATPHHSQPAATVATVHGADNLLEAASPLVAAPTVADAHHSEARGADDAGACALLWMLCVLGVIAVLIVAAFRLASRVVALAASAGASVTAMLVGFRDRLPNPPSLCVLSVCRR
ncbi:hypothetical protein [Lysinibacter cavernae]|uniref:Small neutral amino acid transporter SnatA (MarC family) n=1 Tax=Lysinibacter cavernae TaxID=1640652 RepID=A0A7X5R0A1_9MICO|nr:hypothetical protein [Lysinibacter cavernae]NIH53060.1 small neutral amino acid transporter SnatA (MarC family) [Lysinibacter cavernae]